MRNELVRLAAGTGSAARAARAALDDEPVPLRLRAAIVALARHRGPAGSTCPSDAARAVGGEGWRELMELTRNIAISLARDGEVLLTQRGEVLEPDMPPRGPIRIKAIAQQQL